MALRGLVEVRVSWPGHPRYLKKKKILKKSIKVKVYSITIFINSLKVYKY